MHSTSHRPRYVSVKVWGMGLLSQHDHFNMVSEASLAHSPHSGGKNVQKKKKNLAYIKKEDKQKNENEKRKIRSQAANAI